MARHTRRPRCVRRYASDRLTFEDRASRGIHRIWIERDVRLMIVVALLILIPAIVQAVRGDPAGAVLAVFLDIVAAIVGYFAVTRRELIDRA